MRQQREFHLWRPGWNDAVRGFLLSEHFQGAMQLTTGILFVSLFVFVSALRFQGSCVAVLLYIVVAVTAAPDNHVGTRIFMSGFMLGPMWLAILVGAVVSTIAKLLPTPKAQMAMLCVLGPLAIIPFAIVRMGMGHLYLWAMGMIAALYVGMPIIAGFALPGVVSVWMLVVFIIVAALVAMFAGSALSMLVLPSLASHAVEDDVALAVRQLGQHLTSTTSHLFRSQASSPAGLLPRHLCGIHPLLLQDPPPKALAPGLLEMEMLGQSAAHDVYVALMDWFERQSRPSAASQPKAAASIVCGRRTAGSSETGSTTAKSTFYGAGAAGMAAAVAAAAADSFIGWDDADSDVTDTRLNESDTFETADVPASSRVQSKQSKFGLGQSGMQQLGSLRVTQISIQEDRPAGSTQQTKQQQQGAGAPTLSTLCSMTDHSSKDNTGELPKGLQFSSSKAAATLVAEQLKRAASGAAAAAAAAAAADGGGGTVQAGCSHSAEGTGAQGFDRSTSMSGTRQQQGSGTSSHVCSSSRVLAGSRPGGSVLAPIPHIADIRQLLAHANRLLDAAAAEPQWLRGSERCFKRQKWAAVIAQAQLLATRLAALDLVQREHCALLEDMQAFSITGDMQQLLQTLYASCAAALAMLSEQAGNRSSREQSCRASTTVLQGAEWREGRQQLMMMLEATLVRYCTALHEASEDAPFVMPRAHWVRQLMFFILATSSVMDAMDALAAAATAALTAPPRSSRKQQQQQQTDVQLLPKALHGDLEAGVGGAAAAGVHKQPQPQHDAAAQSEAVLSAAAAAPADPPAAAAAAASEPSCSSKLLMRLSSDFARHTAWVSPWLPLALNRALFAHLKVAVTKELPAMFSSTEAFIHQLKGRRFRAGLKYWIVLSCVMVGTLLLLYCVPASYRYAPNFGYSAAAVGMSDRVESTVHKVVCWTASAVVGATLGWALMVNPALANNAVALAAIICCFCLVVGSLNRSKNTLVILYTLMTVASVAMCQYTPACCDDTGSTMMAVVRGASVAAASLFAVAVQNLVWPWYTSSWALEQLGLASQEAAELLAGMVCELYSDTHAMIVQQQQQQQQQEEAAAGSAEGGCEGDKGGEGGDGQQLPRRLAMLTAGVLRVQQQLIQQQQQQQQQQQPGYVEAAHKPADQAAAAAEAQVKAAAAAVLHTNRVVRFEASDMSSNSLHTPSLPPSPAAATRQQPQQQQQQHNSSKSPPDFCRKPTTDLHSSRVAALQLEHYAASKQMMYSLQQQLRERRQQRLQAAGPAAAAAAAATAAAASGGAAAAAAAAAAASSASNPLVLQLRLLRPLVQVKISLLLDTTAWSSGLYATPPVVLRMLAAMFDVADALGALQQASSIKVAAVSGSWDWTLAQMSCTWSDVQLAVVGLADATLAHVTQLSDASAAALLSKIQEVQHLRFEFFARSRDLRLLLHIAVASDESLLTAQVPQSQPVHLQGQMRYSAAVYAAGKVLDRMTTVARCALEAACRV